MTENEKLIEKIRKLYAKRLGRELGALSQFARDIKVDPRNVHFWKDNDRPIPSTYAAEVEDVTGGVVSAVDVVTNEIRHRKERLEARRKAAGYKR